MPEDFIPEPPPAIYRNQKSKWSAVAATEASPSVYQSKLIGTMDISQVQAQTNKSFIGKSSLTEYILDYIYACLWVLFLIVALIASRNNDDNFATAVLLTALTTIGFLVSYLVNDPGQNIVIIINIVGASLAILYGLFYLGSEIAGSTRFLNPNVLAMFVAGELVIYLASPWQASLRTRRILMVVFICIAVAIHASLILRAETAESRQSKMQASVGSVLIMSLCTFFSTNRGGIPPDVVGFGFVVQYYLGMFVLTTATGQYVFESLGAGASSLLSFAAEGASFLFRPFFSEIGFVTLVLPTTIYFSALTAALNYLGVLPVFVKSVASCLKKLIGTNLVQSVNASANLFLGMTEAPLLILPFLGKASPSDIHCVMVGGFASIAGAVLAAYIALGISAPQLLGASVMSVPGTLVLANIVCPPGSYPEEELEQKEGDDELEFPPPTETNIVEAAGNGTQTAIFLVLNIGAMLIAFLSLLALMNSMLGELGSLVGIDGLSFQMMCSYVFAPVAYMLGTPWKDCQEVARIIGTKMFVNEFIAYEDLAKLGGSMEKRSVLIATYACCGFANVGSIGVMLGALSSLVPERNKLFAKLVVRAMITGNLVSWLNASYAAVLAG